MSRFWVRVEGRNVVLRDAPGAARRQGFVTAREVEAPSREDAGEVAMEQIFDDPRLRARIGNAEEDPPLLYLSDVHEAAEGETLGAEETEYAFFEEEALDLAALLGEAEED